MNNLFAKWWLIDDHDLFSYLIKIDKESGILDYISILIEKTEVGNFARTSRFRPSYFILRVTELYLFGLNPTYFYIVRLLIAMFFSVVLFLFLIKFINEFVSLTFVATIWTFPFWSDVFSRIGPAEIYGCLGLGLLILSYLLPQSKLFSTFLRVFGLVVLIGAKENFLIYTIVSFVELWKLFRRKNNKVYLYFFEILPILYSIYIFLSLVGFYTHISEDIYGNSTNLKDRLNLFIILFEDRDFWFFITILVILSAFSFFDRGFLRRYLHVISLIIFAFVIYIFNFAFYHAKWPTGMRYDFPGVLLLPMTIILFLKIIQGRFRINNKKYNFILIFICIFNLNLYGLGFNLKSSIENRNRTNQFSSFLNETIGDLKLNPNRDIVIRIISAWDYEPYFSILDFFNYYSLTNRVLLRVDSIPNATEFENQLLASLKNIENLNVQPTSNCLVLTFGEVKDKNFCDDQINRRVPW
ncbi:hypothetical protein [Leptospira bouyouniensis]|uniref:hypothetical protein n=1 Tax=Leptospira bouyouniensis TaxID=2484911 RepID=UPI001FED51B1|nr:hypothetical protein [Leptospira bouyouniensis]